MSYYNYLTELEAAYNRGFMDYWEGASEYASPYSSDSDTDIAWSDGWNDARQQDEEAKEVFLADYNPDNDDI